MYQHLENKYLLARMMRPRQDGSETAAASTAMFQAATEMPGNDNERKGNG